MCLRHITQSSSFEEGLLNSSVQDEKSEWKVESWMAECDDEACRDISCFLCNHQNSTVNLLDKVSE